MTKTLAVLILSGTIAAIGCAPSIAVKEDFDPEADFTALHTYDWIVTPTNATGSVQAAIARNSLLDKRIKASVNDELAKKGYMQNAEAPDFLVLYHTGAVSKVDDTDWCYGYGYGGYQVGYPYNWNRTAVHPRPQPVAR